MGLLFKLFQGGSNIDAYIYDMIFVKLVKQSAQLIAAPNQKISDKTRFTSAITDHAIMGLLAMVFAIPYALTEAFIAPVDPFKHFSFPYFSMIGFAIYFCKDCINGRSIAKRVFHLQVVNNKTGLAAAPIRCFVRNVFCILWPMEILITLFNTSRRLGDRVAGTRLVYYKYDDDIRQPQLNVVQMIIAFALSYGLMYLVCLPMR